jgi:hypothetical protein
MPPHCDTLDGPIVTAARRALELQDVNMILPYAPKSSEEEIRRVFDKVMKIRSNDLTTREVADNYFFETVVRLHRIGEGASFTGLKPAGLYEGPIIPVAEKAIQTGSPRELIDLLKHFLEKELLFRFKKIQELKNQKPQNVDDTRDYIESMLGLQVYAHKLFLAINTSPLSRAPEPRPPQFHSGHQLAHFGTFPHLKHF